MFSWADVAKHTNECMSCDLNEVDETNAVVDLVIDLVHVG